MAESNKSKTKVLPVTTSTTSTSTNSTIFLATPKPKKDDNDNDRANFAGSDDGKPTPVTAARLRDLNAVKSWAVPGQDTNNHGTFSCYIDNNGMFWVIDKFSENNVDPIAGCFGRCDLNSTVAIKMKQNEAQRNDQTCTIVWSVNEEVRYTSGVLLVSKVKNLGSFVHLGGNGHCGVSDFHWIVWDSTLDEEDSTLIVFEKSIGVNVSQATGTLVRKIKNPTKDKSYTQSKSTPFGKRNNPMVIGVTFKTLPPSIGDEATFFFGLDTLVCPTVLPIVAIGAAYASHVSSGGDMKTELVKPSPEKKAGNKKWLIAGLLTVCLLIAAGVAVLLITGGGDGKTGTTSDAVKLAGGGGGGGGGDGKTGTTGDDPAPDADADGTQIDEDKGTESIPAVHTCSSPPNAPSDGQVAYSSNNDDGSVATFSCSNGFTQSGSTSVTCDATTDDAAWPTASNAPTCTVNRCETVVHTFKTYLSNYSELFTLDSADFQDEDPLPSEGSYQCIKLVVDKVHEDLSAITPNGRTELQLRTQVNVEKQLVTSTISEVRRSLLGTSPTTSQTWTSSEALSSLAFDVGKFDSVPGAAAEYRRNAQAGVAESFVHQLLLHPFSDQATNTILQKVVKSFFKGVRSRNSSVVASDDDMIEDMAVVVRSMSTAVAESQPASPEVDALNAVSVSFGAGLVEGIDASLPAEDSSLSLSNEKFFVLSEKVMQNVVSGSLSSTMTVATLQNLLKSHFTHFLQSFHDLSRAGSEEMFESFQGHRQIHIKLVQGGLQGLLPSSVQTKYLDTSNDLKNLLRTLSSTVFSKTVRLNSLSSGGFSLSKSNAQELVQSSVRQLLTSTSTKTSNSTFLTQKIWHQSIMEGLVQSIQTASDIPFGVVASTEDMNVLIRNIAQGSVDGMSQACTTPTEFKESLELVTTSVVRNIARVAADAITSVPTTDLSPLQVAASSGLLFGLGALPSTLSNRNVLVPDSAGLTSLISTVCKAVTECVSESTSLGEMKSVDATYDMALTLQSLSKTMVSEAAVISSSTSFWLVGGGVGVSDLVSASTAAVLSGVAGSQISSSSERQLLIRRVSRGVVLGLMNQGDALTGESFSNALSSIVSALNGVADSDVSLLAFFAANATTGIMEALSDQKENVNTALSSQKIVDYVSTTGKVMIQECGVAANGFPVSVLSSTLSGVALSLGQNVVNVPQNQSVASSLYSDITSSLILGMRGKSSAASQVATQYFNTSGVGASGLLTVLGSTMATAAGNPTYFSSSQTWSPTLMKSSIESVVTELMQSLPSLSTESSVDAFVLAKSCVAGVVTGSIGSPLLVDLDGVTELTNAVGSAMVRGTKQATGYSTNIQQNVVISESVGALVGSLQQFTQQHSLSELVSMTTSIVQAACVEGASDGATIAHSKSMTTAVFAGAIQGATQSTSLQSDLPTLLSSMAEAFSKSSNGSAQSGGILGSIDSQESTGNKIWTYTINPASITENKGATVIQANGRVLWTYTVDGTSITGAVSAGVAVTQSSSSGTGTLHLALEAGATVVIVKAAIGQVFDTAADLVVGSDTTFALADLVAVSSVTTPNAQGTLEAALTGSGMTTVLVKASASGTPFDQNQPLLIGSTPGSETEIASGELTEMTQASSTGLDTNARLDLMKAALGGMSEGISKATSSLTSAASINAAYTSTVKSLAENIIASNLISVDDTMASIQAQTQDDVTIFQTNRPSIANDIDVETTGNDALLSAVMETDPSRAAEFVANLGLCSGSVAVCGDSVVGCGEQCDDGNAIQNDACGNDCLLTSTVCSETCAAATLFTAKPIWQPLDDVKSPLVVVQKKMWTTRNQVPTKPTKVTPRIPIDGKNSSTSTEMQDGPTRTWTAVASSADGKKLYAADFNNILAQRIIYTSADDGSSWTELNVKLGEYVKMHWTAICTSLDGVKVIAAGYKGTGESIADLDYIYKSVDSGATWTTLPVDNVCPTGAGAKGCNGGKGTPFFHFRSSILVLLLPLCCLFLLKSFFSHCCSFSSQKENGKDCLAVAISRLFLLLLLGPTPVHRIGKWALDMSM